MVKLEKKVEKLLTPFCEIQILIDGEPVPYFPQERRKLDNLCPHVLRRYQISVQSRGLGDVYKRQGLECEAGYINGARVSDEYDYDAGCLENGVAFLIDRNTRTERYVFGISWIDHVSWGNQTDDTIKRDVETWYGADPTLGL